MYREPRLLYEQHNALNRNEVKQMCVIIVAMVVWISETIVTDFARFPRVDAPRIGHFVQPFESGVGWSEAADGCHRSVPEKLIDDSSAQGVVDAPVR
jgi:hypothetical protein